MDGIQSSLIDCIYIVLSHRKLLLTLVDHHILPAADGVLDESVVEIVDHRQNERLADMDGRYAL